MTHRIEALAHAIVDLQAELDREIERRRVHLGWALKDRLVEFEHGIVAAHKTMRNRLRPYLAGASIKVVLTAPVIYSLILPLALLDLFVSIYQAVCFPVYRISPVYRRDFIAWDRQKLRYLNWIELVNCQYCAYANGVIAYVREVASRTEQYWCPIKHAVRISSPHERYTAFLEYGDAEGYRTRLEALRQGLREDAIAFGPGQDRSPASHLQEMS